ncbi:hypothetical protein BJX76DRAFT_315386 [Aspergillus varians]
MSSYFNPSSQTLETCQTLSGSFDTNTSLIEHIHGSQQLFRYRDHNRTQRQGYYSSVQMWICCQCGDGPKLLPNQSQCVECHHSVCSSCSSAK